MRSVTECSAALQSLVEGSETELEEGLCLLNASWARIRTLAEDWLSSVLVGLMPALLESLNAYEMFVRGEEIRLNGRCHQERGFRSTEMQTETAGV